MISNELIVNSDVFGVRTNYYGRVKFAGYDKTKFVNLVVEQKLQPEYNIDYASVCLTPDEAKKVRDMLIELYPLAEADVEPIRFCHIVGDNHFVDVNDKLYYLVGDVAYPVKVKK